MPRGGNARSQTRPPHGRPALLDLPRPAAHTPPIQTAGQPLAGATPLEESPGSTGIRCRLTAGGGDPRESATENKPPNLVGNHGRGSG